MLTRSQTLSSAKRSSELVVEKNCFSYQTIAANKFIDQVDQEISRKTRAIRRTSFAALACPDRSKKDPKIPNNLFTIIRTRSQTKNFGELEVNIDFDESSREWTRNKRRMGNGTYSYR
jgi:hypothetical protein